MSPKLQEIYDCVAAAAYDKQEWLAFQLDEGYQWKFNSQKGLLALNTPATGRKFSFDGQILGSESEITNTWLWLWAWANKSGLPKPALAMSNTLRAWGEEEGVTEFTTELIPLETATGIASCVDFTNQHYSATSKTQAS